MDWQGFPGKRVWNASHLGRLAALTITLEGVRQDDPHAGKDEVRAAAIALARAGRVSYRVAPAPKTRPMQSHREKRADERRRSRLRSGKLLDPGNRFLCECLVYDRSSTGLRIKLMKNVGLPNRCRLFDDETGEVKVVATVWRRETFVGMRYCPSEANVTVPRNLRAALQGRYYAIAD
jgi:hypothetical protein